MASRWQEYQQKFQALSSREQMLITATGLVAVVFVSFSLAIDPLLQKINSYEKSIRSSQTTIKSTESMINILNDGLSKDPNKRLNLQLQKIEQQLKHVDGKLLELTTELISPIQMRMALQDILRSDNRVSLLSFEISPAQSVILGADTQVDDKGDNTEKSSEKEEDLTLYRHELTLTLSGSYFALQDYLKALESLKWKFFWQEFDYQLTEYPKGTLVIRLYSLSTKRGFIGV